MDKKFLTPYNSVETEQKIYTLWEKSGFFNPDNLPSRHIEPFTIIMPPPNVTGILHMGMSFDHEDIMIRFERIVERKLCGFQVQTMQLCHQSE